MSDEEKKLISELASFISHQIKSPLAAIKGRADLIVSGVRGESNERIVEEARQIMNIADRCIDLTNNILDLRRIEEGKMIYEFGEVSLKDLLQGLIKELELLAERKGIKLIFENFDRDFKIQADKRKLHQAVQNIIDNGIKYTDSGEVTVGANQVEGKSEVVIYVRDTGRGIDPKTIPNLFTKFTREAFEEKSLQGVGLGLFITKEIIEAHNGKVWVESLGRGKGSSFYISLQTL